MANNSNINKIFDLFFAYTKNEDYYDWDFIEHLQIALENCSEEERMDPSIASIAQIVKRGIKRIGEDDFTGSGEFIDPIYELLKQDKRTRIRFLYM